GGMLAMALLYPLDQIKTIMQGRASASLTVCEDGLWLSLMWLWSVENGAAAAGDHDEEQAAAAATAGGSSVESKAPAKRESKKFWVLALAILKAKKWQVYQGHVSTQVALGGSNFVYFFCYNGLKTQLLKRFQQSNRQMSGAITPLQNLVLSCLAGVINVYICAPLWVANMRLKSKDHAKYSGVLGAVLCAHWSDCLRKITADEGFLSLWNGTLASLVLVSNPVIHYVSYERMKVALQQRRRIAGSPGAALSALDIFMLGALAKSLTTVVTYPLQVAQSLMRVQKKASVTSQANKPQPASLTGCLAQIYTDKGVAGYFAGIEAKLLQTVLTAAISLVTYEKLLALILLLLRQQQKPAIVQKAMA
ncbi:hypothetical protein BBJ28_00023358, partial [Nothophytophthora sp. Chile5]